MTSKFSQCSSSSLSVAVYGESCGITREERFWRNHSTPLSCGGGKSRRQTNLQIPFLALLGVCVQVPVSFHSVHLLIPEGKVEVVHNAGNGFPQNSVGNAVGFMLVPRCWHTREADPLLAKARSGARSKHDCLTSAGFRLATGPEPSVWVERVRIGVYVRVKLQESQCEAHACLSCVNTKARGQSAAACLGWYCHAPVKGRPQTLPRLSMPSRRT